VKQVITLSKAIAAARGKGGCCVKQSAVGAQPCLADNVELLRSSGIVRAVSLPRAAPAACTGLSILKSLRTFF